MARFALHQKQPRSAAESALAAIERIYNYPMAHFLLGVALTSLKDYARAAQAYRAAVSLNPNFPQAHLRLARLLKNRLDDEAGARQHFRIYREMRRGVEGRLAGLVDTPVFDPIVALDLAPSPLAIDDPDPAVLPPLGQTLNIVSGLPRSGTSMVMQMLAAAGLPILTDGPREADEDNPRGYYEFEQVKSLHEDITWLKNSLGRVVKIVAPVLRYLPTNIPCRIVLIERNLDEILTSQFKMIERRGEALADTPERLKRMKQEYFRLMLSLRSQLRERNDTPILYLRHDAVVVRPLEAAERLNRFFGGSLDLTAMAAEVQPKLHRNQVT